MFLTINANYFSLSNQSENHYIIMKRGLDQRRKKNVYVCLCIGKWVLVFPFAKRITHRAVHNSGNLKKGLFWNIILILGSVSHLPTTNYFRKASGTYMQLSIYVFFLSLRRKRNRTICISLEWTAIHLHCFMITIFSYSLSQYSGL